MGLPRVKSGDPLRGAITADGWNALGRLLDADQRGGRGGPGPHAIGGAGHPGVILVRNDTGEDRDRFQIVGLGGPVFTPTDNESDFFNGGWALKGELPDVELHAGKFGVLLEPCLANGFAHCLIHGLALCRLEVPDDTTTIESADIDDGDATHLIDGDAAKVLWHEPGDPTPADKWAIVLLGGGAGARIARARLTADLAWEGSATAVYRTGAPGSVVDGTATITVYDDLLNTGDDPLLSGSKVIIAQFDGHWWVIAVSCPAS